MRALLAKHNIRLAATHLDSDTATALMDALALPGTYGQRLASQRRLMLVLADERAATEVELHRRLCHHPGYRNLLTVKGIGPVLAAVFVAEIGDVTRFPTAGALCCWAGLTPRHYESDKTVHRGHISKEGDPLVRWAAVEAIQRQTEPAVKAIRDGIVARRCKTARNVAKVAAARRMLEVVYYVLRDGHARCLATKAAA
jgi:transposase